MKRQSIEGGFWFDVDGADHYREGTRFDGQNQISRATGSQWDHEDLYRTRGGRWVLCSWSQWQGSGTSYVVVTPDVAAAWLVRQGRDVPEEIQSIVDAQEV